MQFTITIEGREHIVEIAAQPHETLPAQVTVNGRRMPIDVKGENWLQQHPRSLMVGADSYEVLFEYGEDGFPRSVWVDGKPQSVTVDFPGKGRLSKKRGVGLSLESAGNAINAPMPGKIVALKVKEGQKVEAGQLCVVLEAMKMENELTAPRACVVKKVLVAEGANVDLNQLLVTLE